MISIIIPVFREQERINDLIDHIHTQGRNRAYEIIIVDGDSPPDLKKRGETEQREGVVTIYSARGRGKQMNAGASIAQGEILLFLHADTRLPDRALEKIASIMKQRQYVGGAFNLGIDSSKASIKLIAFCASVRSRITRVPFGDQAIFILNDYFKSIGGYKEIPLMEDVDLMKRIKKQGNTIYIMNERVITSPRNWAKNGILFTTLRNWLIQILYFFNVSPHSLVKLYYR